MLQYTDKWLWIKAAVTEKIHAYIMFTILKRYIYIYIYNIYSIMSSGSGREEQQEASREQGPLAVVQAQDEQPCWGSAHRGPPGEATAEEEEEIRRVAHRLMAIGDQINATVLYRPVSTDGQHPSPRCPLNTSSFI